MQNLNLGNDEDLSTWDCPVCFHLPEGEIFQCANRHAICDVCSTRIHECPTCRSPGVKIRNRLAESLLDRMEFPCSWIDHGCMEIMKRGYLSNHEDLCEFNPSMIPLCSLFQNSKRCKTKFNKNKLCQSSYISNLMGHMTTIHGYKVFTDFEHDTFRKAFINNIETDNFAPTFFNFSNSNSANLFGQLYFRMRLTDFNKTDRYMALVVVNLTPEAGPVKMNITISGNDECKTVSKWGIQSVPTLNWAVQAMDLAEFSELLQKLEDKDEDRFHYPFWLPVSFLQRSYADDTGKLKIIFSYQNTT